MLPEHLIKKIDKLLDKFLEENLNVDIKNHYAFFWDGEKKVLKEVKNPVKVNIDDLIGIERQKELVLKNTEKFVNNKPANNVLLWGERGTGKSSLVKGLINIFANKGLRIIQVLNHDVISMVYLFDIIQQQKDYKFIIFLDDLSFNENDPQFRELKTILDGGIYEIPENLLFYATSNRKNLMPVKFSDRQSDEKNPEETLQEKISLVERFGLRIGFFKMEQDLYLEIVNHYAQKFKIKINQRELEEKALRWALEYGRNGRTAYQFVKSLG